MSSPFASSADTGSGEVGVNLAPHITGNPLSSLKSGSATVGHTWAIIAVALGLLWLFGGVLFKSIRMG